MTFPSSQVPNGNRRDASRHWDLKHIQGPRIKYSLTSPITDNPIYNIACINITSVLFGQMLKAPPLKSLDLHFSGIKCNCQTYDNNIAPKLKKPSFAIFGANNMFDNRFNQYRTGVCPEIGICRVYDEVLFF